jgi:EAL domain-containing protein (putative c-di-GMP-specific phosphodiesterase class I)
VLGAEALARWIHPTRGFMSPDEFIPVLERNGMIADVDIHIWRCACEILKRWQENGIEMFISINISPKDFYFMNVPDTIVGLVKEFGIEPSRLRIEITETVMIGDVDNRIEDICRLREFGFIIEMDDFGSGYSSLNLLQDMPVDVLKIDMAFLRKAEDNPKAEMILYNIIAMSKDLELISLTEGVESLYQFEQLSRMGCKMFQGYLFSKPIPIEEFEKYCKLDQTI